MPASWAYDPMDIREAEKLLPNGFRGSVLRKIIVRNRSYELKLYLDIDAGTEMKKGIITVTDLVYFILDDSEEDILGTMENGIKISESGAVESLKEDINIPGPYVEEAFRHYFFLPDFGKYMFVSGMSAELELEEP